MNSLTVTSTLSAFLGLLVVALAGATVAARVRSNTMQGDGGDASLARAIRAHGNLIEYAPIFLILLGLLELRGAPGWGLVSIAATFAVSRALYVAYAYGGQALMLRIAGFWTTALPIAVASVWLVLG